MDVQNLASVPSFITKDGSEIRELLAHRNSAVRNQSLAEARVPAGTTTAPHYHPKSEEIYFILEGCGLMRLGDETRQLVVGDAVAIPPWCGPPNHQLGRAHTQVFMLLRSRLRARRHDLGLTLAKAQQGLALLPRNRHPCHRIFLASLILLTPRILPILSNTPMPSWCLSAVEFGGV